MECASGSILIMGVNSEALIRSALYPMHEICSVSPVSASMLKSPSMFVSVPFSFET